ncbi:hypothetical protein ABK040_006457 [Willaertia magna]
MSSNLLLDNNSCCLIENFEDSIIRNVGVKTVQDLNDKVLMFIKQFPTDGTYDYDWTPAKTSSVIPNTPLSSIKHQTFMFEFETRFSKPVLETKDDMLRIIDEMENKPIETIQAYLDFLSSPPNDHCLCNRKVLTSCICGYENYGIVKDITIDKDNGESVLVLPSKLSSLRGRLQMKINLLRLRRNASPFPACHLQISTNTNVTNNFQTPKLSFACTFCCGVTFEVFYHIFQQYHNRFNEFSTVEEILSIKRDWFCEKNGDDSYLTGCLKALKKRKLGIEIEGIENAKAGDFIQFWRKNGSGHSVIFIRLLDNERGEPCFEYWSSQRSKIGISYKYETIEDVKDFYITRFIQN